MTTISQRTQSFNKTLVLDPNIVRQFSSPNNWRATFDIFLRVIIHVGLIWASFYFFSQGQYLLGVLVAVPHWVAFSFLGWAGIGHELFHNNVFSAKLLNKLLFRLFSILTWSNYGYFEITHWKHHKDTLLPDDPEGNPTVGLPSSQFIWLFTFDLPSFIRRIRVLFLNAFGSVPGDLSNTLFRSNSVARKQLVNGARVILISQAVMIMIFLAAEAYPLIFLVSLASFFLTFVNRLLAVSQHYGTTQEEGMNYFANTRTVLLDRVCSFLYANMNYHVEHHFFPSVPYYNLPSIHQYMASQRSFQYLSSGLLGMVRDLRRLGCFKK